MWGAIASVAGSMLMSDSAGSASSAQAGATNSATAEQRRQYDLTRADNAPWLQSGTAANQTLAMLLGLQPNGAGSLTDPGPAPIRPSGKPRTPDERQYVEWQAKKDAFDAQAARPADPRFGDLTKKFTLADFWDDPITKASYQQGLDQGTKALTNMAGARGNLNSGATLKALTRFGTDYTGNQAADSRSRFVGDQDNIYNRLAGISGTGQVAAQGIASAGQNSANNISNLLTSQGNARGAAAIAQGNAWGGGLQNIGNMISNRSQTPGYGGGIPTGWGGTASDPWYG